MTKYGYVTILFLILILGLLTADAFMSIPVSFYLILISVYIIILFIAAFFIRSNFYFNVHNRGDKRKNRVAVTFDDGPERSITPELLKILAGKNIKATFFCIGEKAVASREIIKQMDEEGHIVGNHSYTHSAFFDFKSTARMIDEINRTNDVIEDILDKKPLLFRPPYGVTNPLLGRALRKTNMIPVGWRLRSYDTLNSYEKVLKRIRKKLRAGDIILLHDNDRQILRIVPELISFIESIGFEIINLDELLGLVAYEKK
jgi:peptidoglycan/xylan/chitin deacetylase (PgdA/CDA1 family)